MMSTYKRAAESQIIMTELMQPHHANFGGKVHGGHILSLIDKVAYVCASKHAEAYCVTVSVDAVDFLHPIEVGELVSFFASVNYTGKTSMRVGIKVVAENIKNKTVRHTNSCYINMVAMDEHNKPKPIPGLTLTNETEVRRYVESIAARKLTKEFKSHFNEKRVALRKSVEPEELVGENCLWKYEE